MKKLIAIVMVLGLVGFAVAQDLDSPTSGVAVEQQQAGGGGNFGDVYNMIISNMQSKEAAYIARQASEWDWIAWGYWVGAGTNWNRGAGNDYSWASDANRIHYELWNQLSPAEFAAANAEFNASWDRVLAAGLN